jgi:hypothetical protein
MKSWRPVAVSGLEVPHPAATRTAAAAAPSSGSERMRFGDGIGGSEAAAFYKRDCADP